MIPLVQEILLWVACIITIEAATEIEVESQLFAGFRDRLSRISEKFRNGLKRGQQTEPAIILLPGEGSDDEKPNRKGIVVGFIFWYIHGLFSCGYCLSVWVSAAAALVIPTNLVSQDAWYYVVANFAIKVLVLHRISNLWHEAVYRWINRMPFMLGFSPVDADPNTIDTGDFDDQTNRTDDYPERSRIEGNAEDLPPGKRCPRPGGIDGRLYDAENQEGGEGEN